MKEHIQANFDKSHQRFNTNKIVIVLAERGDHTSPKYMADLMWEKGLQSVNIYSKRNYQKSVKMEKKQNILQGQFQASKPNLVWVSDINCFKINEKYIYVYVILSLFSRKSVAHGISPKNSIYVVTSTSKRAIQTRGTPQGLTFHSDQGAQYTSKSFRKLLRISKIVQSFSKSGSPHDNVVTESFFASVRREKIYRTQYKSERQFRESIDQYITFW